MIHLRPTFAAICSCALLGLPSPLVAGDPEGASGVEFFESKIRPVLVERCAKCHAGGEKGAKGGLRLDGSAAIRQGGSSGPMLGEAEPGQFRVEESILLSALSHAGDVAAMPPDAKLPEKSLADFRRWVELGAPMPDFAPAAATAAQPAAKKAGVDFAAGRKFWAFLAAVEQPVPAVTDPTRVGTRVDPFIQQDARRPQP